MVSLLLPSLQGSTLANKATVNAASNPTEEDPLTLITGHKLMTSHNKRNSTTDLKSVWCSDSGDHTRWCERKMEEHLKEEEEMGPLEEVDLDPRKEKEDPMSPRRRLLWQSMCVTLAQQEMQVIASQSQISSSTALKGIVLMLVTQKKPFEEVWNLIGKH